MKKSITLFLSCAVLLAAACESTDIPEAASPSAELTISRDGAVIQEADVQEIYRGESTSFNYTAKDISKILSEAPEGWTCSVSVSGGSITVTAPEYSNTSVSETAQIKLLLYDGSGGDPSERYLNVKAASRDMEFDITDPDLSDTFKFSLGSQQSFTFKTSQSVKDLLFTLPKGWTAEVKSDGVFVVTAPDLSIEEGDANGTIVVTPVSWSGESGTAISKEIKVRATFDATFQFEEKEINFNFGETKVVKLIVKGVKSYDTPVLPSGWTGDFGDLKNGSVTITAPAENVASRKSDSLKITGLTITDDAVTSSVVNIRLYGINSTEDLLAFRDGYGATSDKPSLEGIEKYQVGGELYLNSDIDLPESTMASIKAYFIKHLTVPFNGNNHTINVNYSSTLPVCALFQYIEGVKISNLNLKGSMNCTVTGTKTRCAALAATVYSGSQFENITSAVNVYFKATDVTSMDSYVAAFVAGVAGTISFKNCKVTGDLTLASPAHYVGGFTGQTDTGKPGANTTFEDCEFAGNLNYTQAIDCPVDIRLGGMVGDLARQGVLTRCKFTGKMTFNLNGYQFIKSIGRGAGGIAGRITAPASGYTMKVTMTDCSASGSIVVNGVSGSDIRSQYQLLIGCKPGNSATILSESGSTVTGSVVFN